MWSAPKRFTPVSTIRFTSSSTATSPTAACAWPPAFSTSATVSSAALLLMSHTTMRAPSAAKRTAASRPIPMPAPVIRAILFVSLFGILDPFKEPHELPVGDGLVEGLLLEPAVVEVVLDDSLAEGLARQLRALQLVERLAQRLGHLAELGVLVGVAVVEPGRLEPLVDPVKAGRDRRGEGEIRVGVGARDAVFHTETRPLPAEAEPAGTVVPACRDARGRERARLVALVGVDRRRVEVGELARHRHLPRQPLLEERSPLPAAAGEEALLAGAVPERGVEVEGRARGTHVVLRHEGDGASLLGRDLLDAVLVEHVAIGHLERLGIAEVDLLL